MKTHNIIRNEFLLFSALVFCAFSQIDRLYAQDADDSAGDANAGSADNVSDTSGASNPSPASNAGDTSAANSPGPASNASDSATSGNADNNASSDNSAGVKDVPDIDRLVNGAVNERNSELNSSSVSSLEEAIKDTQANQAAVDEIQHSIEFMGKQSPGNSTFQPASPETEQRSYSAIEGNADERPIHNEITSVPNDERNTLNEEVSPPAPLFERHNSWTEENKNANKPSSNPTPKDLAGKLWQDFGRNANVLFAAFSYKDGGGYNAEPSNSGTPKAIIYNGKTILKAGNGTSCVGYTFTVAMDVATERHLLDGKSAIQMRNFRYTWYARTVGKMEKTCVQAMVDLGIGREIPFVDAEAGDFVQFFRTTSPGDFNDGHSVIFLSWITENGKVIGMNYRSSQGKIKTPGIGNKSEYFTDAPHHHGSIVRERTHIGRLN